MPDKSKWIPTDLDVNLGLRILKDLKSDSATKSIELPCDPIKEKCD
ncbi:hypothetical protein KKF64_00155 [Patescibacteria group bacterium]|nr:hypothetical protein [Patescibacteria group bacterium]